jgi:hypothetical protein
MLLLTLAAAVSATIPDSSIVAEFQKYCEPPIATVQTVLAQADRDGWRKGGAGAPTDFDPATQRLKDTDKGLLKLGFTTVHNRDNSQWQVCGLSISSAIPNIVPATEALLGFAPFLNMGSTANFFAVRSGATWRSGTALSHAEFLVTQAQGRFYSIVASSTETYATIYALREIPSKAP